jgi:hypothetical protein
VVKQIVFSLQIHKKSSNKVTYQEKKPFFESADKALCKYLSAVVK